MRFDGARKREAMRIQDGPEERNTERREKGEGK